MISLKSQTTSFTWSYIHIGEIMVKLHNSYELLYTRDNAGEDNKSDIQINTGKLEFKDVFFRYNKDYIFKNFNLKIEDKQKIMIFGDYDADGITSITVLKKFLNERGMEVGTYIPNRLNEGYGLNKNAIEKIAKDGVNLIITVDCGISGIEEDGKSSGTGEEAITPILLFSYQKIFQA